MNLITTSPTWLVIVLMLTLAAAAIEDAVRLRISNITCGAVFIAALVAMALHGFSFSLWQNAVVCIAILVLGTPAFAAGWLGGGDVKLLAALGLWFNLQAALSLVAAVFIAGGVVALMFILVRFARRDRRKERRIPYGLAIAIGAVAIFGMQLHQRNVARYPWQPYFQPHGA
ncbi:MAG TPA: prepilin peptidase [Sphingomicrobium sp.]|jgi:prepilin peptidase CpaA|nr:prepilin peptidase [Sphingomicrobium sp.]